MPAFLHHPNDLLALLVICAALIHICSTCYDSRYIGSIDKQQGNYEQDRNDTNSTDLVKEWVQVDWNRFQDDLVFPDIIPNYLHELFQNMPINETLISLNNGTMPSIKLDIQENILSKCEPTLKPVRFKQKNKLSVYVPPCIMVHRCGGCCYGNNIKCIASKKRIDIFKVVQVSLTRKNGVMSQVFSEEHKVLQVHESCECVCSVKSEDCSINQKFISSYCKCTCKKMLNCSRRKTWDSKKCECKCRKIRKCSHGRIFDKHVCRCRHKNYYKTVLS